METINQLVAKFIKLEPDTFQDTSDQVNQVPSTLPLPAEPKTEVEDLEVSTFVQNLLETVILQTPTASNRPEMNALHPSIKSEVDTAAMAAFSMPPHDLFLANAHYQFA